LFSLKGKVALLTGASGTVGRAIAVSLATAGADLVLNYLSNEAGVKETEALAKKLGSQTLLVRGDVTVAETAQKAVDETLERFD
jgi:NAD(P)-dependent dehydrogenase (short-subunit alcohol dehydrogenase family)